MNTNDIINFSLLSHNNARKFSDIVRESIEKESNKGFDFDIQYSTAMDINSNLSFSALITFYKENKWKPKQK